MAAEQPTSLPRWASDANRTVEPASGEKDVGWVVGNKPPARKMNWLFNLIYQWTQYLQSPKGTGAGAGVSALGGDTDGTGLEGSGGGTNGIGVLGSGTGTGYGVKGVSVTDGAAGVYGETDGAHEGVKGYTSGLGGIGVLGQAIVDDTGVKGLATDGHGVIAESDTSSPVRSALRVVPQDTEPTTKAQGDFFVHDDGKPSLYNGDNWDRFVMQSYAQVANSGEITNTTAETVFDKNYTIPADTLRVGSTIRVRAGGQILQVTAVPTFTVRLRIGGVTGTLVVSSAATVSTNDVFFLDMLVTIRTVGATGTAGGIGIHIVNANNGQPNFYVESTPQTLNTTITRDLVVTGQWSAASASNRARLDYFAADIL